LAVCTRLRTTLWSSRVVETTVVGIKTWQEGLL